MRKRDACRKIVGDRERNREGYGAFRTRKRRDQQAFHGGLRQAEARALPLGSGAPCLHTEHPQKPHSHHEQRDQHDASDEHRPAHTAAVPGRRDEKGQLHAQKHEHHAIDDEHEHVPHA